MTKSRKSKVYKFALGSLLVGSLVAPAAIAAGCSTTETQSIGSNWVFNNHQTVREYFESASGQNEWIQNSAHWMTPAIYEPSGNGTARTVMYASTLSAFRSAKPQKAEVQYDKNTKVVTGINDSVVIRNLKIRFEMISAVILVDESGNEYVFDKDISAEDDVLSTDPRDVNSKHFTEVLTSTKVGNRINSIKLKAREDLGTKHWIQNGTGQKGSNLSLDDLYLGFVYSILTNPNSRLANSNLDFDSTKLPKDQPNQTFQKVVDAVADANGKINPKGVYAFATPSKTDGISILQQYSSSSALGLQIDAFTDLSRKNEVVLDGGKTFQLKFSASSSQKRKEDLWRLIGVQRYFSAKPYTETLGLKAQYDDALKNLLTLPGASTPAILTNDQWLRFTNSLTYKAGFYQNYFGKFNEHYSAGTYVLGTIGGDKKSVEYNRNEDYVDSRWLNQVNSRGEKTTFQKYIAAFISEANVDGITAAYRGGQSIYGKYSQLQQNEKIDADKGNSEEYGVYRSRGFVATSVADTGPTKLTAIPIISAADFTKHYFNDNFSKLLYGLTSKEINERSSKFSSGEYLNYLLAGDGFTFRRLLMSVMNAFSAARDYLGTGTIIQGTRAEWPTNFTPDGAIYGSDTNNYSAANPFTLSNLFSSEQETDMVAIAKRFLNRFIPIIDANGKVSLEEINRSTYSSEYTDIGFNKYGPQRSTTSTSAESEFAKIQRIFKTLLDKYVGALPTGTTTVPDSQKVIFEYPYGISAVGNYKSGQEILKAFQRVFSDIDPRLTLVAIVNPTDNKNNVYQDASVNLYTWPDADKSETFKFTHGDYDDGNKYPTMHAEDRTMIWGDKNGLGFAALTGWSIDATQDVPVSPLLANLGFLQTGKILTMSYYSDPANYAKYQDSATITPVKRFLETIRDDFNQYFASSTLELAGFKSSRKDVYLDAFRKIKFEDIWKSDPYKLDKYDYEGFKGLEEIVKDIDAINAKTSTNVALTADEELQERDHTSAQNFIQSWLNLAIVRVWPKVSSTYTAKEITEAMLAWNVIAPENFNVIVSSIPDPKIFTPSLRKVWYYLAGTGVTVGSYNISMDRVDLDYVDNYYLGLPLVKAADGTFRTVKNGGIVY